MCRPFSVCNTKMPPSATPLKHTHTYTPCHLFALTLLSLPPHLHNNPPPPIFPARAPMSKPNTTDQQLGMQIVSRDKLCAACQLHTWALGWLSVTCVRVPLHLRRATLMTWCRVSLQCTHPTPPLCLPSTTTTPLPLHPLLYHPPPITRRWDSVSPPEGRKEKKCGFKGIEMDNSVWSGVGPWWLMTEGLYMEECDQYGKMKVSVERRLCCSTDFTKFLF